VASQDPADPGIRVDSVEMLGQQGGADVRDALLDRILHDPNAAVRLKALQSIRRFSGDPATRNVLRSALEQDVDPAVRSEAIDILAPINERPQLSPELAATLQNLARSENDDYVRERCLQLLHAIHAPLGIY
jgi:HEAT repeat protein